MEREDEDQQLWSTVSGSSSSSSFSILSPDLANCNFIIFSPVRQRSLAR